MSRVTEFPDDEGGPLTGRPVDEQEKAEGGQRLPRLPKLTVVQRISDFYHGIKLEMRKTTWPTRTEVWSTTVVVIVAVIFFGFYLWGVDWLVTQGFRYLEKAIK